MNPVIQTLSENCTAFSTIHETIQGNIKGNLFFCFSRVFEMLYRQYPEVETSVQAMHSYLKENYKSYDLDITNHNIDRIIERKHKPVLCSTLMDKGLCIKKCIAVRNNQSPYAIVVRKMNKPDIKISSTVKKVLSFTKRYELTDTQYKILLCLLSYMNGHDNVVYPSGETISKDTGVSKRSIWTNIVKLEQKSLIQISKKHRKGQYDHNKYKLLNPVIESFMPSCAIIGEGFAVSKLGEDVSPLLNALPDKGYKPIGEDVAHEDISIGISNETEQKVKRKHV